MLVGGQKKASDVKPYTLVAGELLRRRFGKLVGLLPQVAVFTAIAARVLAQNQPLGPLSLTLSDAVKLALKQNPQRLVSSIRAVESERDRQAARAALLPQAGVSASQFVSSTTCKQWRRSNRRLRAAASRRCRAQADFRRACSISA